MIANLIRYGILCTIPFLCFLCYTTAKRMIHVMPIFRWMPVDGFHGDVDAEKVRFWKEEVYLQRLRWDTWNFPLWVGVFLAGEMVAVAFMMNKFIGIGAVCILAGILIAILRRRKEGPAIHLQLIGGFAIYGTL
jgi:hypothetical protein